MSDPAVLKVVDRLVVEVETSKPGDYHMVFNSIPNAPYTVYAADSLSDFWSCLDGFIASGTNTVRDIPVDQAAKFYRIDPN